MIVYLLIEHEDIYSAKVVAVFTSESRAQEYGEAYAEEEHLGVDYWWVDEFELDPDWKPSEEEEKPAEPTEEDMHVIAVLDSMLPEVYNAVVSRPTILDMVKGRPRGDE